MPHAADDVIARLRAVVGESNVLAGEEQVLRYCRCTSPWMRRPLAVVLPGTTEEVSRVVRIAGELKLPVWPFSKGKNWGYGASMAFEDGAIILVLERMNRILELDEELAYAVIEPGVTQKQLNDHLRERGSVLWTDCTDSTPEGSVIGNALERGLGYTPYGDHFGHLCGLEVVLADGEVVRTGGGPPNFKAWNTYRWGTGPCLEGLFSQANFGIVTRAGVWLMPAPEDFACFIVELRDERELPAVVDIVRRLALHRILDGNVHLVNDMLFLSQMIQYPYELRAGGRMLPPEARARLRERYDVPAWSVIGGLYGTRDEVRLRRRVLRRKLGPYGAVLFLDDWRLEILRKLIGLLRSPNPLVSSLVNTVKGLVTRAPVEKLEVIPHLYPILKGVPGERIVTFAYFKRRGERPRSDVDPARDAAGLMWLPVVSPLSGRHAEELLALCVPTFERHGFEYSAALIMVNPRSFLALMEIFFDRDSPDETQRALELRAELAELTARAGYPQYRTTVAFADSILAPAPAFQRLCDSIKAGVDPANILAPGRYGIGLRR
jgi:4-cresol dehydrogenase (hydroxylating)